MYIKKISSNKESFKTVSFSKGFNVVLAERVEGSTERDSRNGLGKSTLIEIIHFCLGSDFKKSSINTPELAGWIFRMDFEINGKEYTVSREIDQPDVVFLKGDFNGWLWQPQADELDQAYFLDNDKWCGVLGQLMFNLPVLSSKYSPTFRGIVSYFARRGVEGYQNPFTFFRTQPEWSKQVHNAFLLGLGFEYAAKFQKIKDEIDEVKQIKKVTGRDYFRDLVGSIGELEAEKINKSNDIAIFREELKSFKVHPQYRKIQEHADILTQRIQTLINDRHLEEILKKRYQESSTSEEDVSTNMVSDVYAEAGMNFSEKVSQSIESVHLFHKAILSNRKAYLAGEIERLSISIEKKSSEIQSVTDERAKIMGVLQSHGALEEYSRLNERLASYEGELKLITEKIQNLKAFDERRRDLDTQKRDLVRVAKQAKEERNQYIEAAVTFFNESARELYASGGTLAVGVGDSGYSFKIDIRSSRSQGVGYMKVFCYDLTFTQIQARFSTPSFLVHDSTVFDGVDERQFARALEYVARKSTESGFQYICMLNSDVVPVSEFSDAFKEVFNDSIRINLTDGSPAGSLLGVRFE
jgi:uncharacterized protein YydD (DUF2326 family)